MPRSKSTPVKKPRLASFWVWALFFIIPCSLAMHYLDQERQVFFATDSVLCTECELFLNGENIGKLSSLEHYGFELNTKEKLTESQLLRCEVSTERNELVVINNGDTINHVDFTVDKMARYDVQSHSLDLGLSNYRTDYRLTPQSLYSVASKPISSYS